MASESDPELTVAGMLPPSGQRGVLITAPAGARAVVPAAVAGADDSGVTVTARSLTGVSCLLRKS